MGWVGLGWDDTYGYCHGLYNNPPGDFDNIMEHFLWGWWGRRRRVWCGVVCGVR